MVRRVRRLRVCEACDCGADREIFALRNAIRAEKVAPSPRVYCMAVRGRPWMKRYHRPCSTGTELLYACIPVSRSESKFHGGCATVSRIKPSDTGPPLSPRRYPIRWRRYFKEERKSTIQSASTVWAPAEGRHATHTQRTRQCAAGASQTDSDAGKARRGYNTKSMPTGSTRQRAQALGERREVRAALRSAQLMTCLPSLECSHFTPEADGSGAAREELIASRACGRSHRAILATLSTSSSFRSRRIWWRG